MASLKGKSSTDPVLLTNYHRPTLSKKKTGTSKKKSFWASDPKKTKEEESKAKHWAREWLDALLWAAIAALYSERFFSEPIGFQPLLWKKHFLRVIF